MSSCSRKYIAQHSNNARDRMTSKVSIALKVFFIAHYVLSELLCQRLSYLPTANFEFNSMSIVCAADTHALHSHLGHSFFKCHDPLLLGRAIS